MATEQWGTVRTFVEGEWDARIVPTLSDYIKVPNQSPHFDSEWATNGLIEKAFQVLVDYMDGIKSKIKTIKYEMHTEPGRTPFLVVEIGATGPDASGKTCLMYGHMDKQPPLLPWAEGLGPYDPVYKDGRLYGRGGADDGYALCGALTAIAALEAAGIPHGRIVITIESCEESGSYDLPHYMTKCKEAIGDLDLVVCLDSGANDYKRMWITNSLRGLVGGNLTVQCLREGIHSGLGGGVVPDSFHVLRILLDRIHDPHSGTIKLKEFYCECPEPTKEGLKSLRDVDFQGAFPLLPGAKFEGGQPPDSHELALRNFWGPAMTITGADMPPCAKAGNVVRKETVVKVSCRLPPLVDPPTAEEALKRELERDPPFGAIVRFDGEHAGPGWYPKPFAPWLENAVNVGSKEYFGNMPGYAGVGGSIPFMGMLGEMFPEAQFVVTGVLGPQSNAHGPNEFLDVPFGKGITYCVCRALAAHYDSHQK